MEREISSLKGEEAVGGGRRQPRQLTGLLSRINCRYEKKMTSPRPMPFAAFLSRGGVAPRVSVGRQMPTRDWRWSALGNRDRGRVRGTEAAGRQADSLRREQVTGHRPVVGVLELLGARLGQMQGREPVQILGVSERVAPRRAGRPRLRRIWISCGSVIVGSPGLVAVRGYSGSAPGPMIAPAWRRALRRAGHDSWHTRRRKRPRRARTGRAPATMSSTVAPSGSVAQPAAAHRRG